VRDAQLDGRIECGSVDAALAAGDDFDDHGQLPSLKQKTVRKRPHGLLL
jgi:hypothetical protein